MSEIKKIDLSKVKRKPKQQETRAFSDPLAPGVELVVTLEFPVYLHEAAEVGRWAGELCEFWRDPETLLMRLPPVDEVQPTLTDHLALAYAALEKLQPRPPLYTFRDFNELSVKMPDALAAACDWALSLIPGQDGTSAKRGRKIPEGSPSSGSPSTSSTSTRNGASGVTGAGGVSMNVSANSAASSEEKLLADLDASVMNPTGTG